MNIWALWIDAIVRLVSFLSSEVGLGLGFAIVAVTLLLRTAMLPIAWNAAYRGSVRQRKLSRLQPELQAIKERYAQNPQAYTEHLTALYRKHGLALFDGKSLLGGLVQTPLFLGMYRALQTLGDGVRFLWVASLSRPDLWLAIIAGLTTALAMAVSPDMAEPVRVFLIVVPSVLAFLAALKFSSALAVYWAASNCYSAAQTVALRIVVERRIRSGALKI